MQSIKFERETRGPDGRHPEEILRDISRICHETVDHQYVVSNDILMPALEKENICFLRRGNWTAEQAKWVEEYVNREILPIISPIGIDPAHPFPRLVNKSLNVKLEGNYAIVPTPRSMPRLIELPEELGRTRA